MKLTLKTMKAAILAMPLTVALSAPAVAASAAGSDQLGSEIQDLKAQLAAMQAKIDALQQKQADQAADAKKQTEEITSRIAATEKKQKSASTVSFKSGRPTFSTPDGNFTASIRANVQIDGGYYMQSDKARALATGADLSSGMNIRRAQLGLDGTLFGDWAYKFNYEFGGAGTEAGGKILNAYVQYNGLAPFALRVGAFAPSFSVEDQVASSELMFLERNSPTSVARSVAGGDDRLGISAIYAGPRLFGALSYTASKIAESGSFDEQSAMVGRLAYLAVNAPETNAHLLLSGGLVHAFKLPDLLSAETGVKMHTVTLSDYPEIAVDDTASKLITTSAMNADHYTAWTLETAGNYKNFYLQGAYYGLEVDRAPTSYSSYSAAGVSKTVTVTPKNSHFSAWYLQGSWVVTGESKPYLPATAAFGSPKPAQPFSIDNGTWGAWEIAARYSDTNLNAHMSDTADLVTAWSGSSKTYTFYNAVGGGKQKNYTFGLNWYPNSALRFVLDYMLIDVDRTGTTNSSAAFPTAKLGQKVQAVALRTQVAF